MKEITRRMISKLVVEYSWLRIIEYRIYPTLLMTNVQLFARKTYSSEF